MAQLESTLEVMHLETRTRRMVYRTSDHIEAPNWTPDGRTLVFNSQGRLYFLPAEGGDPLPIDTGSFAKLNNDHGISPDGQWIVISDKSEADGLSRMAILPFTGGTPRHVIPQGPSYWHGWSPDCKTLVYVGARDDRRLLNLYACPVKGGSEKRLTFENAMDDGPDYSADGRFIFFNSTRSGNMKIPMAEIPPRSPLKTTRATGFPTPLRMANGSSSCRLEPMSR